MKMEETMVKTDTTGKRGKRYWGKCLSWVLMALLILIIIPIGAVMFVVSGLWSAVDRALAKLNK